jgi:hypothetical protein
MKTAAGTPASTACEAGDAGGTDAHRALRRPAFQAHEAAHTGRAVSREGAIGA